jgi:hypothetical protein
MKRWRRGKAKEAWALIFVEVTTRLVGKRGKDGRTGCNNVTIKLIAEGTIETFV